MTRKSSGSPGFLQLGEAVLQMSDLCFLLVKDQDEARVQLRLQRLLPASVALQPDTNRRTNQACGGGGGSSAALQLLMRDGRAALQLITGREANGPALSSGRERSDGGERWNEPVGHVTDGTEHFHKISLENVTSAFLFSQRPAEVSASRFQVRNVLKTDSID